ncbi:class II heat shock protein [Tanacetum coccineum]
MPCSHSGLFNKGLMLFQAMVNVYGIAANEKHYACVVDLYARPMRFEEAEDLVTSMCIEPDGPILGALASACKVHGNEMMLQSETRFTNLNIWEFLRLNPSTLGEEFFKAHITEARFEIIAKEQKEHTVEKKIDVILPLQGEFASPKAKGSLNADEYIGVEEVVAGGEALGIGEDDDLGDAVTDGDDDAVENGEISILNSLIGHGSPRSL